MDKVKVLIVEDERIIAWDLKNTLERMNSEVLPIAYSAESAVEYAQKNAPDLILMDIILKGDKTGIDTALEIRKFSMVPIIYLTGNTNFINAAQIQATQAQGMYSKPPSEEQLHDILKLAARK